MQKRLDRGHAMTDKDDCSASRTDVAHFAEAALLKAGITHSEDFIDQEDFRLEERRHRKRESQVHAAGIPLHRSIDEALDFGEGHDLIELPGDLIALIPRMAPFRNTFSLPVSSWWNPVPTSRRLPTRP